MDGQWTAESGPWKRRRKALPRHKNIETLLEEIVRLLVLDRALPEKHSDHAVAAIGTIVGNATSNPIPC
ncbi:MAG: type II toxin-antitoxin system RelE/ParE family toxin [Acidobacteriaceae bacterium]